MAIWTPERVSTALWLDAADNSARIVDSGAISQLTDKSGNARHATAAGSARPSLQSAVIGGLDVARFNGTSHYLITGDVQLHEGEWSAFAVAKSTGASGIRCILSQDQSNSGAAQKRIAQYLRTNAADTQSIAFNATPSAFTATRSATITSTLIYGAVRTATDLSLRITGGAAGTASPTGTAATGSIPVVIGARRADASTIQEHFNGDIGEVVVVPFAVSASLRQIIEGYLAHRWGLSSSLSVDHPYKDAAPQVLAVYGTVRDKAGAPAARTVTAIRDSTGTISGSTVSNAITGAYEIELTHDESHTLVFSGEADRNAIVYSGVMPT